MSDINTNILRQILKAIKDQPVPGAAQQASLNGWRQQNPHLSASCRRAATMLQTAYNGYLETLTDAIIDSEDLDNEFILHALADRFGSRVSYLNNILQVLSTLGEPSMKVKT